MIQHLMVTQSKDASALNKKLNDIQTDARERFEAISIHLRLLDAQVAQRAEETKRPKGALPARPEQNPKTETYNVNELGQAREVGRVGVVVARTYQEAIEEMPPVKSVVNLNETEQKDEESRLEEKPKDPNWYYDLEGGLAGFKELSLEESKPKKEPTKKVVASRKDTSEMTLACKLNGKVVNDALVDTGSDLNLISLELVRELGITKMSNRTALFEVADGSRKRTYGTLFDFPILVGNTEVITELQVVDKVVVPLFLGRAFLYATRAVVNFRERKIILPQLDEPRAKEEKVPNPLPPPPPNPPESKEQTQRRTREQTQNPFDPYYQGIFELSLKERTSESCQFTVKGIGDGPPLFDEVKVLTPPEHRRGERRLESTLRDGRMKMVVHTMFQYLDLMPP